MNIDIVKQVTIISGKGGTGKSSIIAAIAKTLQNDIVLADADVDAADLYLIFTPEKTKTYDYYGLKKANINKAECIECGKCKEVCRFKAISEELIVEETKCEGCALCFHICPVCAIKMNDTISGQFFVSQTRIGEMTHAHLNPGEESSGLLVAEVRKLAKKIAAEKNKKLVLIDGSPGIGCPVISSLTGTDLAIVVTEPTLSGFHDLDRILQLLEQFHIPGYIIINRFDINEEITNKIIAMHDTNFPIISKIPYNSIFVTAMLEKKSVVEIISTDESVSNIQREIVDISNFIQRKLHIDN